MANILFKKSYLFKNFKRIPYDNLWNTKGIFTTIRLIDKPPRLLFLKEHIIFFNQSLKIMNINFKLSTTILNKQFKYLLNKKVRYDHLIRIAINNTKISFSIRKRNKIFKSFTGILVNYKRQNPELKNLSYRRILSFMELINTSKSEIILTHNNKLLEGCTTNIICVKKNKLFIPKNNYYFGITLKFIKNHSKRKIYKQDIAIKSLSLFEEIILVGSGKGIVQIKSIPQIKWNNKSDIIFNELQDLYKSYIIK